MSKHETTLTDVTTSGGDPREETVENCLSSSVPEETKSVDKIPKDVAAQLAGAGIDMSENPWHELVVSKDPYGHACEDPVVFTSYDLDPESIIQCTQKLWMGTFILMLGGEEVSCVTMGFDAPTYRDPIGPSRSATGKDLLVECDGTVIACNRGYRLISLANFCSIHQACTGCRWGKGPESQEFADRDLDCRCFAKFARQVDFDHWCYRNEETWVDGKPGTNGQIFERLLRYGHFLRI